MSLSLKHQKFVDAYLGEANGNATRAAEIAGYKGGPRSLAAQGSRMLTNVNITEEIQRLYAEKCLSAHEVLGRLSDQARGIGEFVFVRRNGTLALNYEAMQKAGKMHLVHALKETQFGQSVEFYDAQAALVHIGRNQKLFTDRTESDINVTLYDHLSDAELDECLAEAEAGKAPQIPPAES